MLNKINDLFDRDTEEKYLERYAPPIYKKIRNIMGLTLLSFIGVMLLIGFNIKSANQRKEGRLYAVDSETNKVSAIQYSYSPSYSEIKFSNFITSIMEGVFTTNFDTVDDSFKKYKKYFTEEAWDKFEFEFSNKFAEYIRSNSLIANLTITSKPILFAQKRYMTSGKIEKIYGLEGFISYKGAVKSRRTQFPIKIIVTIEQTKTTKSPYGLLINSITLK